MPIPGQNKATNKKSNKTSMKANKKTKTYCHLSAVTG
jgi:hypothetical protein